MRPILYFGCLGDKGHYLFRRVGRELGDYAKLSYYETKAATPWGDNIDGGVFSKSPRRLEAGAIHACHLNGWSLVYWADYSVDTRPGSHSTFVTKSEDCIGNHDLLIARARIQWPEVFGRPRFPVLT